MTKKFGSENFKIIFLGIKLQKEHPQHENAPNDYWVTYD
jgi:hypothetical protein